MIIYDSILFPALECEVLEAETWSPLPLGVTRVMAPSGVQVQIPGTCEWVNSHGQRDFADDTNGTNLEMGDYPGPSVIMGPVLSQPLSCLVKLAPP